MNNESKHPQKNQVEEEEQSLGLPRRILQGSGLQWVQRPLPLGEDAAGSLAPLPGPLEPVLVRGAGPKEAGHG